MINWIHKSLNRFLNSINYVAVKLHEGRPCSMLIIIRVMPWWELRVVFFFFFLYEFWVWNWAYYWVILFRLVVNSFGLCAELRPIQKHGLTWQLSPTQPNMNGLNSSNFKLINDRRLRFMTTKTDRLLILRFFWDGSIPCYIACCQHSAQSAGIT